MYRDNGEHVRAEVQRNLPRFMWLIIMGVPAIALTTHWIGDGWDHMRHAKTVTSARMHKGVQDETKHGVAAKK